MKTLEVNTKLEELDEVSGFVMSQLEERCSDEDMYAIQLAIEELFVNLVNYAYNPEVGKAWITCDYNNQQQELMLQIKDEGVPFNPLTVEEPDVESDIFSREIGALGIFLVKKCMDSIDYAYRGACNIVTLRKHFRTVGGESIGF